MPDIPLLYSRWDALSTQNDGFVKKISEFISKKVADKLSGMCKTEKEEYDKYWDDISPFIKFGCLKDDKFCEKMNDYILFKNLEGKYLTLPECLEVKPTDEETPEADSTEKSGGAADENREAQSGGAVDENGEAVQSGEAADENGETVQSGGAVDENGEKVEAEIVSEEPAGLEVLAFIVSVRSASMRRNLTPSFLDSSWEMKG